MKTEPATITKHFFTKIATAAALLILVALLLVACGQPASTSLTLDSEAVELTRGGQVEVEVTITRSGSTGADYVLAATGLPDNVTASFAPGTLTAGATTATLTLTASAAASEGQTTVTVSATGSGPSVSAELQLDVASLTVTGKMVNLYGGPLGGAIVSSQGDVDITDANGEFTLTGLSVPYEITSHGTSFLPWYHVFEGLTESDPLLSPLGGLVPNGTAKSATLGGTFTGGSVPVAANQVVRVCVEGLDGIAIACDIVTSGASSYTLDVQWFDSTTRAVRVHAIQFEYGANDRPVSYLGYGTADVTLINGVAAVGEIDLGSALEATPLQFTVAEGSGTLQEIDVSVGLSPAFSMVLLSDSSLDTSYDLLMPVIPGAVYSVTALAGPGLRIVRLSGAAAEGAAVQVPEPVTLLAPSNGSVGVTTGTSFVVSDTAGAELTYLWQGSVLYGLTTKRTTVTIPDGSAAGLGLPADTDLTVQVVETTSAAGSELGHGISSYASAFLTILLGSSVGTQVDGTVTISSTATVTTAP